MRITNNVERRLFAEVALGNEWRSERKKYEEQDERSHAVDYKPLGSALLRLAAIHLSLRWYDAPRTAGTDFRVNGSQPYTAESYPG
jgi:hypothetical protein